MNMTNGFSVLFFTLGFSFTVFSMDGFGHMVQNADSEEFPVVNKHLFDEKMEEIWKNKKGISKVEIAEYGQYFPTECVVVNPDMQPISIVVEGETFEDTFRLITVPDVIKIDRFEQHRPIQKPKKTIKKRLTKKSTREKGTVLESHLRASTGWAFVPSEYDVSGITQISTSYTAIISVDPTKTSNKERHSDSRHATAEQGVIVEPVLPANKEYLTLPVIPIAPQTVNPRLVREQELLFNEVVDMIVEHPLVENEALSLAEQEEKTMREATDSGLVEKFGGFNDLSLRQKKALLAFWKDESPVSKMKSIKEPQSLRSEIALTKDPRGNAATAFFAYLGYFELESPAISEFFKQISLRHKGSVRAPQRYVQLVLTYFETGNRGTDGLKFSKVLEEAIKKYYRLVLNNFSAEESRLFEEKLGSQIHLLKLTTIPRK